MQPYLLKLKKMMGRSIHIPLPLTNVQFGLLKVFAGYGSCEIDKIGSLLILK